MTLPSRGLVRLVFIQIAGGAVGGFIALAGLAVMWGAMQTKLDRAIEDIKTLSDSVYTQRDAALQLDPMREALRTQSRQIDDHERRLIRLEAERQIKQ